MVLTWYDEMTFRALYEQVESTPVPDRGQTWQEAAQEWMDACQEVHLSVSGGSPEKFTWVKNVITPTDDATELLRQQGEINENVYCFGLTVVFVPENELALVYNMAGNTDVYGDPNSGYPEFEDIEVPDGAYIYSRQCRITREADGWHGSIRGTGGYWQTQSTHDRLPVKRSIMGRLFWEDTEWMHTKWARWRAASRRSSGSMHR